MRRANWNDNYLSGPLADRGQWTQLSASRFTTVVEPFVDLMDRLTGQYTVNCPSELSMIMWLAAGRGALVSRADAEKMVRSV